MRRVIFSGVMLFSIVILSGCEEYSESQKAVGSSITTQLVDDVIVEEKEHEKAKEEKKILEVKPKEEEEEKAKEEKKVLEIKLKEEEKAKEDKKKKELGELQEKKQQEEELKKKQAQEALIVKQAEETKKKKKKKQKKKKKKKEAIPKVEVKKNTSKCHPSYSGRCLKIDAGDYDCKGGSGNGPNYTGKVKVVGYDEFGLDRDKDGWGCN